MLSFEPPIPILAINGNGSFKIKQTSNGYRIISVSNSGRITVSES